MSESLCVFCFTIVNDVVCYECNDYKGLMPIPQAKVYLGEEFPEEYLELA